MTFEQKVCEHIPGLMRYAFALCGEKAQAEDLVQDCLERALRKRHLWRPASTIKPWLFRILYHIYLNQRGSARYRKESLREMRGRIWPSHPGTRLRCTVEMQWLPFIGYRKNSAPRYY